MVHHDKLVEPNQLLDENQPQKAKEKIVQPSIEPQTSSIPFPGRLRKEKEKARQCKFLENLKQLHIILSFIEALAQMPKYAKFLKSLLKNKARLEEACKVTMTERCSAVLLNNLPSKEKNPGTFTILCDIGNLHINNALVDLGASIRLMPYSMYEKLGPGDSRIMIILGRPFLASAQAMIDVFNKKITLRVCDDEVIFDTYQSIKGPPAEDDECYGIDDLDETINVETQGLLGNDESDSFLLKGLEKSINQSDLESCDSIGDKSGDDYDIGTPIRANEIDEKKPALKDLPHHLEYAYLHGDESFPIIILSKLSEKEEMLLLQVLEKRKGAIAWKMSDIKGIRFFQIPIAPEDQEKTTFTCPYGTFAYRRMVFGLCNAPATFQRCMTAIFHDMVEDFMEVFMEDFSVFDNSFNCCLANLDKMLARCEETNLVLNWEKCHFMVKEGIVLGHKIFRVGIEVVRAKIDVIAKLPYPTNVKEVRSFLRHARFYRFDIEIKDKKGEENLATDHLSRLENLELGTFTDEEITDEFPEKHLMILKAELNDDEPWYVDYVNDIVGKIVSQKWRLEKRRRFVYGKTCHLPVEIEHKAYWALKQCNTDLTTAAKNRFMELNEIMELRDGAYENTRIYKERTKKWHDSRIRRDKDFKVGDKVLLFNYRFKMHPVEITNKNGIRFKVNGQRLKKYHNGHIDMDDKEVVKFEEDTT
ncbi:reverse transcriptase domain-containing protein [Tanacetum coccineum]